MANAALVEHDQDGGHFVTALCLNIAAPPAREVSWASAGHDVPWFLDTGAPLPGGRVGAPLGIGADALALEVGRTTLAHGEGLLLFTDGLVEGRVQRRPAPGPTQLFGEDRARQVVQEHRGSPPTGVLDALAAAVRSFADGPLADDLCMVAVRACGPAPA
jgi:serine phosphatase RsbU (regulator of sigma subunit)